MRKKSTPPVLIFAFFAAVVGAGLFGAGRYRDKEVEKETSTLVERSLAAFNDTTNHAGADNPLFKQSWEQKSQEIVENILSSYDSGLLFTLDQFLGDQYEGRESLQLAESSNIVILPHVDGSWETTLTLQKDAQSGSISGIIRVAPNDLTAVSARNIRALLESYNECTKTPGECTGVYVGKNEIDENGNYLYKTYYYKTAEEKAAADARAAEEARLAEEARAKAVADSVAAVDSVAKADSIAAARAEQSREGLIIEFPGPENVNPSVRVSAGTPGRQGVDGPMLQAKIKTEALHGQDMQNPFVQIEILFSDLSSFIAAAERDGWFHVYMPYPGYEPDVNGGVVTYGDYFQQKLIPQEYRRLESYLATITTQGTATTPGDFHEAVMQAFSAVELYGHLSYAKEIKAKMGRRVESGYQFTQNDTLRSVGHDVNPAYLTEQLGIIAGKMNYLGYGAMTPESPIVLRMIDANHDSEAAIGRMAKWVDQVRQITADSISARQQRNQVPVATPRVPSP